MKILFYSDAREFGGHEYMTVSAVRFMARQPHITVGFAYYEGNARLHEELAGLHQQRALALYPLPIRCTGPGMIRHLFKISKLRLVQRVIHAVAPEVVVVSQGNVEVSSLGVLAAKHLGFRTISYLPMAQRLTGGVSLLQTCRDAVDRYLYQLPDKFITISESVKQMLRERGAKAEISVVRNGIELDHLEVRDRSSVRQSYGFLPDEYIVLIVGRIVFGQKGQDLLAAAVERHKDKVQGIRFCVIGDGPDESKLREMIRQKALGDSISMLPWTSDLSSLYSAADMLLIPSRFEGVPLVMLEAMWYQLPIVASDVDGMAELLPREWLFSRGDADSLVKVLNRVRRSDSSRWLVNNRSKVTQEFGMSRFQERFCAEVIEGSHSMP